MSESAKFGDVNDSVQRPERDLEQCADDPQPHPEPEPHPASESNPERIDGNATNYQNDTLPDADDTPFNRLEYVKTFVKVTSKENTSDKVVLVDFFAE
jgi:hypothetical protein